MRRPDRSTAALVSVLGSLFVATPALAQRALADARGTTGTVVPAKPTTAKPAAAASVTEYQIDPTHSELTFRIRHMLGRVNGGFGAWGGTITVDSATPANSRVEVTIKTASIDTKNSTRDNHLRSAEFFGADSFPVITFRSTRVVTQGKALTVSGDLTMHGRTRPVVLTGTYAGAFKDPMGKPRTAFTASTTVNRLDYGITWNKAVETGAMLGDEVTIDIAVEAVKP